MREGIPITDTTEKHTGALSSDGLLTALDIASWRMDARNGQLDFSPHFYALFPELPPSIHHLDDFLAHLPDPDQLNFRERFNPGSLKRPMDDGEQGLSPVVSCALHLNTSPNACKLHFLGSLVLSSAKGSKNIVQQKTAVFTGIVVRGDHFLMHMGVEYISQLLSNLFSDSSIAALVSDQRGVILQLNQAFEKLFELTPRQVNKAIGRYEVLRDKSILADADLREKIKRVYEHGEVQSFEMHYPLQNLRRNKLVADRKLSLRLNFFPFKDASGNPVRVLGLLQDFSREQHAHSVLKQQDQLLYSLINNSSNLITVKSLAGEYLLVNQSFANWVGRDGEDICGKNDGDLFDAQTAARLIAQDQYLIDGKLVSQTEEILSSDDGKTDGTFVCARFLLKDAANKIYAVGQVMTEISRQKAIEETLENQRKELHLLLDSLHSAIWYLDQSGLIIDTNLLALSLVGEAALTGKSFTDIMGFWDNPPARQQEIMQVINSGIPLLKSIESARVANKQRWFTVDKIPTLNKQGSVSGLLLVMTDITDSLVKERALEESEARYKAFIANSSEAIWCYDMQPPVDTHHELEKQVMDIASSAHLSECNNVLVRMLGARTIDEILGSGLVESGSKNFLFDLHYFVENGYQLVDHDITREDSRGRRLCFQISCVGVIENGLLRRVWGTTKDITARKRYEAKLEYQTTHDALTKLPNRTLLYREMDRWIQQRAPNQMCALLLIDLDRFKEINDTLGHQVGDHLLQLIGPRLETEMSEMSGLIARLGGDEFAIFLPRIRHEREAMMFGHCVLDALRQEFDVDGFCTEISASIGVSIGPTQAEDVSTMMRYADVAMYRAKTEMSGLALYNPEFDPHSPKRLAMMGELGRAIREDQLCLHFQPKVSLALGSFYGFEALLRWNHPELGFVPPGEFIPIVEMTSLIHAMTAWVLDKSIAQCRQWHDQGLQVSIAVNLSARNLLDENIPKQIQQLLKKYQLPAAYLELEITESSIMTDPNRAMRVLDHLHGLGVRLSIDDFGTGYSSLAYLKRLPVQTLKIDNSFVRNMMADKQDDVIVNSTIHLAHNLGLKVVAEGVEDEALLQRLRSMGCDEAQGYHIGRPMPVDKTEVWIKTSVWAKNSVRGVDARRI